MNETLKLVIIALLITIGILYLAHFFDVNAEAIIHNSGNPCVLIPLNFGACG